MRVAIVPAMPHSAPPCNGAMVYGDIVRRESITTLTVLFAIPSPGVPVLRPPTFFNRANTGPCRHLVFTFHKPCLLTASCALNSSEIGMHFAPAHADGLRHDHREPLVQDASDHPG